MSEKTISVNRVPNKNSKYENGWRWCSGCNKFYQTKKLYCDICGTRLRIHPKKKGHKGDKAI